MNRPPDSLTRPLAAALLAASALAWPGGAPAASHPGSATTEEISEPDQLALARQAVERGDNAEALSRFVRVLAVRPRDLTALIGAGNAAVDLGDFSAGLAFFGRAEEVDSHNGRVKAGLASALAQTEQPGAALKLFDEAVALGVPEAEIAGDRGLAWDLRGNPRRAQRDYALALANHPDHEVTMRLALSQAISGDRDGALRTLEPWLRKQDQAAWRTRAFVLAITGDTKGASQAAAAVLPPAQATAMAPFFGRLASLNPAQKAMAANFGYLPGDQPPAVQRALSASSAMASASSRTHATIASREPAPAAAVAEKPTATPSVTAALPITSARPATAVAIAQSSPPKPVAVVAASTAAPVKAPPPAAAAPRPVPETAVAVATKSLPAAAVAAPEAKPVAPQLAAAVPPAAAARPPVVVASAETTLPRPAPAAPPPRPAEQPVATLSAADIAAIRAQTAADAESEARSEREMAAKATVPAAPAAKPVAARVVPPALRPPDAGSRSAETKAALETRVALNEQPRSQQAAKPVEAAPAAKLRVEPGFDLAEPTPKLATAKLSETRAATPRHEAPKPPLRFARIVGLPLPADVARTYAAMPHGSALSSDIAVEKAGAKKVELAAADDGESRTRKPAAKAATADVGEPADAKPVKSAAKSTDRDRKTAADEGKPSRETAEAAGQDRKTGKASAPDGDEKHKASNEEEAKAKAAAGARTDDSTAKTRAAASEGAAKPKLASAEGGGKAKPGAAEASAKARSSSSEAGEKAKAAAADGAAKAKAPGERYWVQVAGGSNRNDLDKAWDKLRAGPAGSVLAGHTPSTTPLKATNRLLVGPFGDMSEAQAFVNKLAAAGTSSFTFKSVAGQKVDKLPSQ